jgi:hypothetical protein
MSQVPDSEYLPAVYQSLTQTGKKKAGLTTQLALDEKKTWIPNLNAAVSLPLHLMLESTCAVGAILRGMERVWTKWLIIMGVAGGVSRVGCPKMG